MSHEIEARDVFGEVRVHGQRAWHGLGVEIPDGLTVWPAFEQIGLGWETELLPVVAMYSDPDGKKRQFKIPTHNAHVKADDKYLLGMVGAGYRPISNREMAEFADALVEVDKSVVVETAGSLRNGRCIFTLVKLPQNIEVTDEDVLNQYVLIRNSHDGSTSFQVYPTSVRVVCANTLRWSERDAGRGISFQHTGDVKTKIEHARLALGLITDETKKFEAQVRILAAKHLKKNEVAEYFRSVYDRTFGVVPEHAESDDPRDTKRFERQLERRDALLARWQTNFENKEQSLDGIRGTAWAAYNAISQWQDHERGRFKSVQESDGRVHSNLFGTSHAEKMIAFKYALDLCGTL